MHGISVGWYGNMVEGGEKVRFVCFWSLPSFLSLFLSSCWVSGWLDDPSPFSSFAVDIKIMVEKLI